MEHMKTELDRFEHMLPKAWTAFTSSDGANWSRQNPAWGQCAVTACLIADKFGGDLVRVEYEMPDGNKGSHYFNILPSGERVDITARQFAEGTSFSPSLNQSNDELIAATRKYIESKKFDGSSRSYVLSFPVTHARYEALIKTINELESGRFR